MAKLFGCMHSKGYMSQANWVAFRCIILHNEWSANSFGKYAPANSSSRNTPITAACIQKIRKSSYISNNDGKSSTVDDHQWWRLKKKHPFGTSKIDFHVCVFFLLAFSRNCWPTALSLSMVYVGSFLTQCFGFSAIILLIVCIIPIFFRPFSDTHAIRLAFFSNRPFPTCMFLALTHWSQLAVFVEEKMCIKSMINTETVWTCMNGHTLHASVYWWSWPKKGAWVSVSLATFFDRTATTTTAEQKISGKNLAIFFHISNETQPITRRYRGIDIENDEMCMYTIRMRSIFPRFLQKTAPNHGVFVTNASMQCVNADWNR